VHAYPEAPPARRRVSRCWRIAAALALVAACGIAPVCRRLETLTRAIPGQRPGYGPRAISPVPNLAAIDRMIWMPGLDDGWNPQGLAFARGSLFVSAYRSLATWKDRGPCRVFRIDPRTGRVTGHFAVPPPCGHAGGLAYAGDGKLFIGDTHTLFETSLGRAFGGGEPKFRIWRMGGGLKGAFAISGQGSIWIGDYQSQGPAMAFKFNLSVLDAHSGRGTLDPRAAAAVVAIPTYAQGGAIGSRGGLWIARSDLGWGALDRLDPASGTRTARYRVAGGIEGIAFDGDGRLWCVSEAGARHQPLRYPFFPLLFRLDPSRLHPASRTTDGVRRG